MVALLFCRCYSQYGREVAVAAPLQKLGELSATNPFQGRVLVPLLVHYFAIVFGASYEILFYLLSAAALHSALFALRSVFEELFGWTPGQSLAASFAFLYPLGWNFIAFSPVLAPADFPAIAFYLFGLLAILRGRWRQLAMIVFIGAINRETVIFLVPTLLVLRWGEVPVRRLLGIAVGLTALWVSIRVGVNLALAENGGTVMMWKIDDNLHALSELLNLKHKRIDQFLYVFGGLHLASLLVIWKSPKRIRQLYLLSILFLIPMFFVALFDEFRIYNEAILGFSLPFFWYVGEAIRKHYQGPSGIEVVEVVG